MADRTLILLRHAKSDWSGDEPDVDRPLTKRGKRQAPEAGHWLAGSSAHLDLAVVSPARRARSTWELVAAELEAAPPARIDERVYAASGSALLRVVRGLPAAAGTVVLVGHNPGLEELILLLTGEWVRMPTSALALVTLPGAWRSAGGAAATVAAAGRPPS